MKKRLANNLLISSLKQKMSIGNVEFFRRILCTNGMKPLKNSCQLMDLFTLFRSRSTAKKWIDFDKCIPMLALFSCDENMCFKSVKVHWNWSDSNNSSWKCVKIPIQWKQIFIVLILIQPNNHRKCRNPFAAEKNVTLTWWNVHDQRANVMCE